MPKISITILVVCLSACGGRRNAPPPVPGGTDTGGGAPADETGPEKIIRAFKQGEAGNCTSVGFIKAVLNGHIDDPTWIFASPPVTDAEGRLHVELRNHTKLDLSAEEVRFGGEQSRLVQLRTNAESERAFRAAHVLFALMGKACELDCLANGPVCPFSSEEPCTFQNALQYLDRGLNWRLPPMLMGFTEDKDWTEIEGWGPRKWLRNIRFVRGGGSCVAATSGHTFFVGGGFADLYGTTAPFTSKFGSWLAFKSIGAYCRGSQPAAIAGELQSGPIAPYLLLDTPPQP